MQMIFSRRGDGAPAPKTPTGPDGKPRTPDGVNYFSLEQAVEAFGMSEAELVTIYDDHFADLYPAARPEPDGSAGVVMREIDPRRLYDFQSQALRVVRYAHLADDEFQGVVEMCARRNLDPWRHVAAEVGHDQRGRRQLNIITTINALLLIAERSGKFDGTIEPEFLDEAGNWTPSPWTKAGDPVAARAGVRRKDFTEPQVETATWRRYCCYVQTPKGIEVSEAWIRGGAEQLAKCALALAIRMAFPEEAGQLYIREEMGQVKNPPAHRPPPADVAARAYPPPPLSSADANDPDEVVFDESTPETPDEFRAALAGLGFATDDARAGLIAKLRRQIPYPATSKSFWVAALRRVRERPDLYGGLAA
jgi:phage recombination protein Bet